MDLWRNRITQEDCFCEGSPTTDHFKLERICLLVPCPGILDTRTAKPDPQTVGRFPPKGVKTTSENRECLCQVGIPADDRRPSKVHTTNHSTVTCFECRELIPTAYPDIDIPVYDEYQIPQPSTIED